MSTIINTIVVIAFIAVLLVMIQYGTNKMAISECMSYQAYAQELSGFYMTQYQADKCESVGVHVDAPIKN